MADRNGDDEALGGQMVQSKKEACDLDLVPSCEMELDCVVSWMGIG